MTVIIKKGVSSISFPGERSREKIEEKQHTREKEKKKEKERYIVGP